MLLDTPSYSDSFAYYIEVSLSGINYKEVISRDFVCRSWQHLYFKPELIQYIRIIGRYTTSGADEFFVRKLKAMYAEKMPKMIDSYIEPTYNVATIKSGAIIVKGTGGTNILNENPNEFTCHEIPNDFILIQLNQPYYIGSMRLYVGCKQFQSYQYSFIIETSNNNKTWHTVIDKSKEQLLSSWQQFEFRPVLVTFIKITGTQNEKENVSFIYFLFFMTAMI